MSYEIEILDLTYTEVEVVIFKGSRRAYVRYEYDAIREYEPQTFDYPGTDEIRVRSIALQSLDLEFWGSLQLQYKELVAFKDLTIDALSSSEKVHELLRS